MQEIWFTGIDWNELLPEDIAKRYYLWLSELEELHGIKVPRCLQKRRNSVKNVLHTFVDASQHAYGAIVYMREEYEDQTVSVRLVVAKTRIAPLQSISILKLELLGAKVVTR